MSTISAVRAARVLGDAAAAMGVPQPRPRVTPLVERMTWGASAEELTLYQQLGPAAYIEYHLNPAAIPDWAVDNMLQLPVYNLLWLAPNEFEGQSGANAVSQLFRAMVIRAIYSKRQFYERVVEFWSDHFNIWAGQDGVELLKIPDDRDVIRANALGNFGTLLRASAHSPAMLEYLNNNQNISTAPNENYARELLELHSMGVDAGYTQQDVAEVARCFTGWTYYRSGSGTNTYRFRYSSGTHDTGQKLVLGNVIPARSAALGIQDGEDVLNILLAHPSTAQFIARKMLVRFWGYAPSQAMVDLVAASYTSTGGDIKSMLRVVLALISASAPPLKLKRPLNLLISAMRALEVKVTSHTSFPSSVQTPLIQAGQLPFAWQSPDGYPDSVAYWQGGQLSRWNFGADLMNHPNPSYSGISIDLNAVLAGAVTPAAVAGRINTVLFNGAMGAADLAAVAAYLGPANPNTQRVREGVGLAFASPSFQWH